TSRLVVDDPPPGVDAVDAVDDAVQGEPVDRRGEVALHQLRRAVETTGGSKRLELGKAIALERGRTPLVGKARGLPRTRMPGLEAAGGDLLARPARLSGAAQHVMKDHALHRLRALPGRQPLLIPKPVLPRTIAVSLDRRIGKRQRRRSAQPFPASGGLGGDKRRRKLTIDHSAASPNFFDEP